MGERLDQVRKHILFGTAFRVGFIALVVGLCCFYLGSWGGLDWLRRAGAWVGIIGSITAFLLSPVLLVALMACEYVAARRRGR